VDASFRLETSQERSRHTLAPGWQPFPQLAAAFHPRAALSLPIRAAGRAGLVETRTDRRMAARSLHRQRRISPYSHRIGLARLKRFFGIHKFATPASFSFERNCARMALRQREARRLR